MRLHKKGSVFVMRMRIMPPHDAQKANDNKKESARVLGELGFTRQDDRRTQGDDTRLRKTDILL